jgi:1-deoxy-D-xylulose-5-phosphate reductoisomerase
MYHYIDSQRIGMGTNAKRLVILGSTGSIGQQTLDIVRKFPNRFRVAGLACGNNLALFKRQLDEFRPGLAFSSHSAELKARATRVSMEDMVSHPDVDMVVIATTGRLGLAPAIAALKASKTVAIANKEILVMAGHLIKELAARHGSTILPIDSEHSAVWQCLEGEKSPVSRLLLTASGGPFFGMSRSRLARVTVEDALNHPTWKMGKKVTIDSATLFNKGLEAIEAHWLFDIPYEKIEILVHRQSIVHSMVEFMDGSIKAQMSMPDMRLPIQYALFYPERVENDTISRVSFVDRQTLTFEGIRYGDYPCLKLAMEAAAKGGTYPAVLCAADEVAVDLFLKKTIRFTDISGIVERTLALHDPVASPTLDDILASDEWAAKTARRIARKATACS